MHSYRYDESGLRPATHAAMIPMPKLGIHTRGMMRPSLWVVSSFV